MCPAFIQICRCLPFIQRIHKVEEVVSLKDLRRIVKEKFLAFKDVKDARVVDMLIFKGREELETYLLMHKQRHHLITEYAEPYQLSLTAKAKSSPQSEFLESFFTTSYPQITQKV
jgi:NADH dehydrogenase (ubiquinone) 1 alpha subcomplex subunit 6